MKVKESFSLDIHLNIPAYSNTLQIVQPFLKYHATSSMCQSHFHTVLIYQRVNQPKENVSTV